MKKENIVFVIALITIIISSIISVYAANYLYNSQDVEYDNTGKNIASTNVQGAIDELYIDANNYSTINSKIINLQEQKVLFYGRFSDTEYHEITFDENVSNFMFISIAVSYWSAHKTNIRTIPTSMWVQESEDSMTLFLNELDNNDNAIFKQRKMNSVMAKTTYIGIHITITGIGRVAND